MSGFQWNTSRLGVIHVMEGGGFAENLEITFNFFYNYQNLCLIVFRGFKTYLNLEQ